jgi:hypothetical protein
MRGGQRRSPNIVEFQLNIDRNIDGLNRSEVERRADCRTLRTRAVVTADVDDQCVIQFAHVFHRLDNPANLIVSVGRVSGEDVRLTHKQLLLIGIEGIPLRQTVRPRRELLPLSPFVPSFSTELLDP